MSSTIACRFGFHVGLAAVSYVKVERDSHGWHLVSSGDLPWANSSSNPEQCREELRELLQKIIKDEGIGREQIHVSLHNRLCVTRVVTGNREQVEQQLREIADNSQHYLQLGLGDKLLGHTTIPIDDSRQHGQVAIIKRGLIETIEHATERCNLELTSVDGALTSVCRLAGIAELDRSPLLLIWMGSSGVEIGISYKGRLQLNYHAGGVTTPEATVDTIRKHLKRLHRFSARYRQLDGQTDLQRVLILARTDQSEELRTLSAQFQFKQVYRLEDLRSTPLAARLNNQTLASPGAASALGGLLLHLESNVIPATDVFAKYLQSKPRSLASVLLTDCWVLLLAAALLLSVTCTGWGLQFWLSYTESQSIALNTTFEAERNQLLELDRLRQSLNERRRLVASLEQISVQDVMTRIAHCLPEDCRLDWCGLDSQGELVLKGTMLRGDRTYEVLKALRDLPEIGEVALESVGSASNFGRTATLFEIHCELSEQPSQSEKSRGGKTTTFSAGRGLQGSNVK